MCRSALNQNVYFVTIFVKTIEKKILNVTSLAKRKCWNNQWDNNENEKQKINNNLLKLLKSLIKNVVYAIEYKVEEPKQADMTWSDFIHIPEIN